MKQNFSVLMVIERFFPLKGGSETQCWQLAEYLSRKKIKVNIATKRWEKSFLKEENFKEGFKVFRLGLPGEGRLKDYFSGLSLFIFMFKKRNDFDLVYVNGGLANIFGSTAILVGKLLGKKVISRVATPGELFFSGPYSLSPKKFVHPLIKLRLKIVRKADFFIAQTKQIKKELLIFGVSSKKIKIIPDGIEDKLFFPLKKEKKLKLRKKLGLPLKKIIVTYCGRLVKRKGLINLIEVWNKLGRKNRNALLLLIGSGKNQPDSVEEILKEKSKKSEKNIFFLGEKRREEIVDWLKASDVFVYPSIFPEGTPFSLLEAMSCGLAVIGSNVGGINEVIKHKKTGWLVKTGSVKSLFSALSFLINNSQLREKIGEKARLEIESRYRLPLIMNTYYKLFQEILKK
ncbi:MAG: glycosyltransferase family 4 protein [Microgenomates group bacterium]